MRRVGYDSDTQKYYFRDQNGNLYQGSEGAQYGELRRGELISLPSHIVLASTRYLR
jgi:hypothetical protein